VELLLFLCTVQLVCVFLDGGLDRDGGHHDGGAAEGLMPLHLPVLGDLMLIRPRTWPDLHDLFAPHWEAIGADFKRFV